MKFQTEGFKGFLNEVSFIIIVPFFLMYQYAVQFQYFLPVFGGYLTVGCMFAAPLIFLSELAGFKYRRGFGDEIKIGYLFFLLLVAMISLWALAFNADFSIVMTNLSGSFRSLVIFFVIIKFFDRKENNRKWLFWFFIIYSFMVIVGSNNGTYIVRGLELSGSLFQIDYQSTAVFYILLLIYIAPLEKKWVRPLLYLLSMYSLFMIGARSEMIGCVLLIMVIEFLLIRDFFYYVLGVGAFCVAIGGGGIYLHENYSASRIFNVLSIDSDASMIARSNLNEDAWETISKNPFKGDFGSYEFGHYAHNVLSVWVDFGVLIFLYFITLIFFMGYFLASDYRQWRFDVLYVRAASSYVMLVVMLVFAKNYMYIMIPVTIALFFVWARSRSSNFECEVDSL